MNKSLPLALVLLSLLAGCPAVKTKAPEPDEVPVPGADRTPEGCKPSAGYTWCARTQQCERPWELAAQQSFANTQQAFEDFCRVPPKDD